LILDKLKKVINQIDILNIEFQFEYTLFYFYFNISTARFDDDDDGLCLLYLKNSNKEI
jgi:hypothetical protein